MPFLPIVRLTVLFFFQGVVGGSSLTKKYTFNPKEGIVNPGMVIMDDGAETPSPRLCVLRREEQETYGFNLRAEKDNRGHIMRSVEPGGIAQRSGLQDGDRLLEVNNVYVDDVPHSEVTRKIKMSGNQLCFLVLEEQAYKRAVSQGQDLRAAAGAWRAGCTAPRLCHISRDPVSGLGVNFTAPEGSSSIVGEKGRFSVSLVAGGAADKAGVCKGDRLVWMDGAMVCELTHSALSRMMKRSVNITVLVIDRESEKKYAEKKLPILPSMAVPHNLPHRARKLHLARGPDGYGFLLQQELTPSGRSYHVLRGVESDGPAEKAGMKNGELLLEVNGESVVQLQHQEVVDRVRASGKRAALTTISYQGLDFYSKLGLSPLLFCEDTAEDAKDVRLKVSEGEESPLIWKRGLQNARLCSLQKGSRGFGFELGCSPTGSGTFIKTVVSRGAADEAGLTQGDVVIEVNRQNVERKPLEDVLELMEEEGDCLSLLVMDETNYRNERTASPSRNTPEQEDEELTIL